MSPASYLAAPPRVARVNCSTVVTIHSMWNWLIYAALAVATLATTGGLALLAVRVLQAWRSLKRLRRHVARELDRLADLAEQTADKVESVSDTGELDRSLASLRSSLAQAAVLREAWDEATSFTALIPRK
jgi:hypothetical protein